MRMTVPTLRKMVWIESIRKVFGYGKYHKDTHCRSLSVSLFARSLSEVSFAANKFKIYAEELNQDKRDKRRAGKQTKKKTAAAAALAS